MYGFLRSYDSFITVWLTVIWMFYLLLSGIVFIRYAVSYDKHCSIWDTKEPDWMSLLHDEHYIALQFLSIFLRSFNLLYFYSSTLYLYYTFYNAALRFLLAYNNESFIYPSLHEADFWKATNKASWSFLFSFIVFFKNETWF